MNRSAVGEIASHRLSSAADSLARSVAKELEPKRAPASPSRAPKPQTRGGFGVLLVIALLCAVLAAGWIYRDNENVLTPRSGLGYALGIAGSVMMLLVLLYPLRKRIRVMRSWAKLVLWFRWHMVFGCLGPALVVAHSRFEARSMNGLMALASTLIVAGSGVVGRYLYVRIHRGLSGAKLEARELLGDAVSMRQALGGAHIRQSIWEERLKALEGQAMTPPGSLAAALSRSFVLGAGTRRTERAIVREENASPEERKHLARYFKALRRAGSLAVYERLFALWHVLHLPLIVLLVFTAIIHVIAVHLY